MRKSAYSNTIIPNEWEEHILIRRCHQTINKIMYKKVDGGYQVYCTNCGAKEIMPYKKLKMIRQSHICWNCGRERETTTKTEGMAHALISSPYGTNDIFYVNIMYDWERCLDWTIDHVIHYENNKTFVRKMTKFMYTEVYAPEKDYWRETKAYYGGYYWGDPSILEENYTLKKHYQEAEMLIGPFKSNQKEFITKGVYNIDQLRYIQFFDINNPEDISRNNSYIMKHNSNALIHQNFKLNKYYLEYLKREKIPLVEFMDYARACLAQGSKIDKLKYDSFWRMHDNMKIQIDVLKKKEFAEGTKERKNELLDMEYSKGKFAIKTFDDIKQIIVTGKALHNCIGTYCEKYATKKTNIFYGTVDDHLEFAIEVRGNKLIQARADHNSAVPKETKAFIKEWCEVKGIDER